MLAMPRSVELQRLKRLKEAVNPQSEKSALVASVDWLEDLEARIAALERGLGLSAKQAN
jgi:hypothetical protein